MKRMVFLSIFVGIVFHLMLSYEVWSDDSAIIADGYTYLYSVNTDLSYGPWLTYYDSWEIQYSRSQLAASINGFPSKTIGDSDIYFMPEAHLTAVVYYNNKGLSTVILLIPDKTVPIPDESSE